VQFSESVKSVLKHANIFSVESPAASRHKATMHWIIRLPTEHHQRRTNEHSREAAKLWSVRSPDAQSTPNRQIFAQLPESDDWTDFGISSQE